MNADTLDQLMTKLSNYVEHGIKENIRLLGNKRDKHFFTKDYHLIEMNEAGGFAAVHRGVFVPQSRKSKKKFRHTSTEPQHYEYPTYPGGMNLIVIK